MKNNLNSLKILVLALVLGVGVSYLYAWTAAPGTPTTCPAGYSGCDTPVNVGNTNQTKTGDICTTFGGTTKCLSASGGSGGAVTQILAGIGIAVTPISGTGVVTVALNRAFISVPVSTCQGVNPVASCPASHPTEITRIMMPQTFTAPNIQSCPSVIRNLWIFSCRS